MKRAIPKAFPPNAQWCESVRENIEHLGGARGNKINMPKTDLALLSFSVVPTKAECDALEAKVNVVWGVVRQLVDRLDAQS